jgi:hypothetical protein
MLNKAPYCRFGECGSQDVLPDLFHHYTKKYGLFKIIIAGEGYKISSAGKSASFRPACSWTISIGWSGTM